MKHRGWIALDIDGTVTDNSHHIPQKVIDYLHHLHREGWEVMFVTGRTFSYASIPLQAIDFPFYFAVQNGADIVLMPQREQISRCYLNKEVYAQIEEIVRPKGFDFVAYSGLDHGDFCYYRPKNFSEDLLAFFEKLKALAQKSWIEVEDFSQVPCSSLIKLFGSKDKIEALLPELNQLDVYVAMIRDPMQEDLYLAMISHSFATKGEVLRTIKEKTGEGGVIIGAGDDLNDIPLLKGSDIAIAMANAPEPLLKIADIIAPPASQYGIIQGIEEAIARL